MDHTVPTSPGELIREKLKELGINQIDLSKILGRTAAAVNEIIAGKRGITPETAIQLGAVFGNEPTEWLMLDTATKLSQMDVDTSLIRHRSRLFTIAPVKELERRGWIAGTETVEDLEAELCRFFGVDSLESDPSLTVSLRSSFHGPTNAAQRAWCFRAKRLASAISAAKYDESQLDRGIKRLKKLTAWPENARQVSSVLAEMGIRFVVVEPLMKTRVDGAALWLDECSPVLAVSIRYDRIDNFWHTIGHELSHIKHRDGEAIDVDMVGENRPVPVELDSVERRAEQEAAEMWLAPDELECFITRVSPMYSRTRINQFANRLKVHPGIIVGQLQHRGELGYQACKDSLVKIRDIVVAEAITDGWKHSLKAEDK